MKWKAYGIQFLLLLFYFSTCAQTHLLDSIPKNEGFTVLEDEPAQNSKWGIGLAPVYFYWSDTKRPISWLLNGYFQFDENYKLDYRFSLRFKEKENTSPEGIESIKSQEYQVIVHRKIFSKITAKNEEVNYSKKNLLSSIFKPRYANVERLKQRSLDFDFGLNYNQIPDFEIINFGNLETANGGVPNRAGNGKYTSLVLGFSYLINRNLKYSLGSEKGFDSGYLRYYFQYSYSFLNSVEVYDIPLVKALDKEDADEFIEYSNSGWRLGFEAQDKILNSNFSSYYSFELGWKPHFHDPNTTLYHIRSTGIIMMFTWGLRLANPAY